MTMHGGSFLPPWSHRASVIIAEFSIEEYLQFSKLKILFSI